MAGDREVGHLSRIHVAAWSSLYTALEEAARVPWPFREVTNSDDGWTAMHSAVWNMHVKVVRYLLTFGNCKTWQKGKRSDLSLLHFAVRNRDTKILRLLLASKADVNFADTMGRTALHDAALFGNIEAARLLMDTGADKWRNDSWKQRPWACIQVRDDHIYKELSDLLF
jgi:hypothetical protein